MPRKPIHPLGQDEFKVFTDDEIEDSEKISQEQLNGARLFSSREEYAKSFKKGIRYLEVGVAWGYSAQMFIDSTEAISADLVDWFDQDLRCWSWRKFGSCQCSGMKHELLYTPITHEPYVVEKFKDYKNVKTYKGDAKRILPELIGAGKEYDFVYIDISNYRHTTRDALRNASKMIPVGGVIGLNDYLIYDGIIEEEPYGTFQTVNEFLQYNKNWVVDAIALHNLGFYDIYIRRVF
jgi:hypothetical protein